MKIKKMLLMITILVISVTACKKSDSVGPGDSATSGLQGSTDNTNEAPDANRHIDPDDFVSGVDNPFFPLVPGTTFNFLTTVDDGNTISYENVATIVTHQTKVVQGVTCVVVHDVVSWNGVLIEDTYDWYAQDEDGNVWYFGEDSKSYDSNGNYVTDGSWEAGVDGAKAGYVMWANPRSHIGQPYRQEYYKDVAEDKAKVVAGNEPETVPYGSYQNCIKIREWTPLQPGIVGFKYYKAGVGQLSSYTPGEGESSVLISITN